MRSVLSLVAVVGVVVGAPVAALGQTCAWSPWAAPWGDYNEGPDLFPPNDIHNPTNWDYSLSQITVMNTLRDTPDGSDYALHWFLDAQPPAFVSDGSGSGGVYQEVTVNTEDPLEYSFSWKGASSGNTSWFEFMLIDGPFSTGAVDSAVNPNSIIRKKENANFGWETLTHNSPLGGLDKPTFTPSGTTVTVVLKAGRSPAGGMEAFFDNVFVSQDGVTSLLTDGDFELDEAIELPLCDDQLMFQDPGQANYWVAVTDCPNAQHTTTPPVSPTSHDNQSDTQMTITGTDLEFVTSVTLVSLDGDPDIDGTSITPNVGSGATSLTVDFPTAGKTDGVYDVVTGQDPSPLCLTQVLPAAFALTCPNSTTITGFTPTSATDPLAGTLVQVSGDNLDTVTAARLEFEVGNPPIATIAGSVLGMAGNDREVTFDLTCAPAGDYRLILSRSDGCKEVTAADTFRLIKTPLTGGCAWQPWAAPWSHLNIGDDLDAPNLIYDSTNWDYALTQVTSVGGELDTPDGSEYALHWFLAAQPPESNNGIGSGGVFQEITVEQDMELTYSFDWKGLAGTGDNWFEFLLIDGPFTLGYADLFEEDATVNNPAMIRKRVLSGTVFDWETITDETAADAGPAGPRPQTITPSGTVVTVVLKAGRNPQGSMESLWDNVSVKQNGGANLVVNGDFESLSQVGTCDDETVVQDGCEEDYWRRSAFVQVFCIDPFADADDDGDVDQDDYAVVQACATGDGLGPVAAGCDCFDRPEAGFPDGDDDIDQLDIVAFEDCASGPDVPANDACDD